MPAAFLRELGDVDPLIVDATMESEHSTSSVVTSSPVEQGSDISDHRRVGPTRYRCKVYLQDEPNDPFAAQEAVRGKQSLDQITTVVDKTRADSLLARLLEFHDSNEPFVVITELAQYEGMLFEGQLSYRKVAGGTFADGSKTASTIEVSGTMVQITIAETRTVAGVTVKPRVTQAVPTKQKGTVAPKPAPPEVKTSVAVDLFPTWFK